LLPGQEAFATTRTVTSLNDSGPGSLRDTIAAANSADAIVFGVTATILLSGAELLIQSKNLTIINAGGPDTLTVAQSLGPFASDRRVFHVNGGTVRIFGLKRSVSGFFISVSSV
jgi:hypothetical protein